MLRTLFCVALIGCGLVETLSGADWKMAPTPLATRWATDVTPDNVLPEYPRPQLVREAWQNLNGLWDYALVAKDAGQPTTWSGQILVPFPIESALSGVKQFVGPDQALWYRRTVKLPQTSAWSGRQILLHFGAVDWETTVWLNGTKLGEHRGGFDPFSFDITAALQANGDNELIVRVWDPSDAGPQPRGKQVQKPEGIWYTPVTGIWQTVWLEPVPETYLRGVLITPDIDRDTATIQFDIVGDGAKNVGIRQTWQNGDVTHTMTATLPASNRPMGLDSSPEYRQSLWSPDNPQLTNLELTVKDETGRTIDQVSTYFARRKISLGKDEKGVSRLLLNNKPLFQFGPLDQGWWPDGLYTAPTDDALKFDIEITKQYGFNLIRKHVKVEPERWYYWADKLGMLVWQDMPSGDKSAAWDPFGKFDGTELTRTADSAEIYRKEWKAIIDARRGHPSIVMWVPFNEAWGQFDTVAVTKWTKEYDPTRLVNCASGGNDFPVGDVIDVHRYPGPFAPLPTAERAAVLGEYGGLGLPLPGHTWQDQANWGYRSFTSQQDLVEAYQDLLDKLHPMIEAGLSAAIYTQTTDVEIEVNGLLTYDRAIEKIPVKTAAVAHRRLWGPAPRLRTLVPTSQTDAQTWQYVTDRPSDNWSQADFDAADWKSGPGGFGEPSTPGSKVRTEWKTSDIWLRRTFDLPEIPKGELRLLIHHDEDTEISLNGHLIKKVTGYTSEYQSVRLPDSARQHLQTKGNVLAVHCHQTGGGQYIDVGLAIAE